MYARSNNTLSSLRNTVMTGVSVVALTISAPSLSQAQSLKIEGEGAWLEQFGDETVFSTFRSTPNVITTPFADTDQTADRGDGMAWRGLMTYRFGNGWSVSGGGGFSSLDGSSTAPNASLYTAFPAASFIFPQITTVPDFLGFNAPVFEQIYDQGSAQQDTDIDFLDFDVGKDVGIGRQGKARFFVGLRYASFDDSLRGTFSNSQYAGYYFQSLDVTRSSSFDGIGPRAGFTAEIPLGETNFSIGGTFAVAALFGDHKTTTRGEHVARDFFGTPFSTNTFTTNESNSKTVYSVEIAPQVSYALDMSGMSGTISAGYRFDHYFNISNSATGQTLGGLSPSGSTDDDIKFDGPFLRVGLEFGNAGSE